MLNAQCYDGFAVLHINQVHQERGVLIIEVPRDTSIIRTSAVCVCYGNLPISEVILSSHTVYGQSSVPNWGYAGCK